MKKILKCKLPTNGGREVIRCGLGRWLDIQIQYGLPYIWVITNDNAPQIDYEIISVGTEQELPDTFSECSYLGTAQDSAGFVWHYFVQLADIQQRDENQYLVDDWLAEILDT